MCGRYALTATPVELQRALALDERPEWAPRYNIAPRQLAPVLTAARPRVLTLARWGLLPHWAKDAAFGAKTFNARSETVATKPAFRAAYAAKRCAVPCSGFFEWRRDGRRKVPLYIKAASGRLLTMAGLWSTWQPPEGPPQQTFTVVTCGANDTVAPIHDRMPVFLDAAGVERWLAGGTVESESRNGSESGAAGSARTEAPPLTLASLLVPWAGEALVALEVSPRVNAVAHDDAACIEPVAPPAVRATQLDLF